jgi:hypothetical protein
MNDCRSMASGRRSEDYYCLVAQCLRQSASQLNSNAVVAARGLLKSCNADLAAAAAPQREFIPTSCIEGSGEPQHIGAVHRTVPPHAVNQQTAAPV